MFRTFTWKVLLIAFAALLVAGGTVWTTSYAAGTPVVSFVTSWGSPGTGPGQFSNPNAVAVDPAGNVYVVESWYNQRVQKFTSDGVFLTMWGGHGGDPGRFNAPQGVAVDGDGHVYVADTENLRVQKFTADGSFLDVWGRDSTPPMYFCGPHNIAVDGSGNWYTAEYCANRVRVFAPEGALIREFTTGAYPYGLAVDTNGDVYVTLIYNSRVEVYSNEGTFLRAWGSPGSGPGQFSGPAGVAIDAEGNVFVGDAYNHRIQVFTREGEYVTEWGLFGTGPGEFNSPARVCAAPGGRIIVTDSGNSRIQVFHYETTIPNAVPSVDAGGPYSVLEGGAVTLSATGTDPDGDELVYAWDLNRDGEFEAPGQTVTFSAEGIAGPAERAVTVKVTDPGGLSAVDDAIVLVQRGVTALGSANVWIGLANSDDVGIRFDLMAEVYIDGVLAGWGELASVKGGSSGFNNASLYEIPLTFSGTVALPEISSLSIVLYARNACSGSGKNSGRARLWFNDVAANSGFAATSGASQGDYFLLDGFVLGTSSGVGPRQKIDVQSGSKCSSYKPFGTWSILIP